MAKYNNAIIQLNGVEDLKRMFNEIVPREMASVLRASVSDAAKKLADDIRPHVPVEQEDGGYLKASLGGFSLRPENNIYRGQVRFGAKKGKKVKALQKKINVKSGAKTKYKSGFYWRFNEKGTVHQKAHEFVGPEFKAFKTRVNEIMRESFGKKIEKRLTALAKKP